LPDHRECVRRDYLVESVEACFSMEIAYNRFERTVQLRANSQTAGSGLASNGILVIRVTEG